MRLTFLGPARLFLLCGVLGGALTQNALAQPPPGYTAYYWIHQTPSDPNSPVTVKVHLILAPQDSEGAAVGWAITSIEIAYVDLFASSETTYAENNPTVPTADGLWWVTHADVSKPATSEFALPPHLSGTATANGLALNYDWVGVAPDPRPTPPYTETAWLSYSFEFQGDPGPIAEGAVEPADSDPPRRT
jgi:hypothetical protein